MRHYIAAAILAVGTLQAQADEGDSWLSKSWDTVTEPYEKGTSELYVPFLTHHLRSAYTQEQIDSYQEYPMGLGYGRGFYDEKANWKGVYVMGFQDSHYKPEWIVGYSWKAMWGDQQGFQTGLGYTVGLTARSDIGNYIPFPVLLPVASVSYGKASLEATYIPGGTGNGNVLFCWGKLAF